MSEGKQASKDIVKEKKIELQGEAKVVRKIVLIVFTVLFLLIGGIIGGGYFYIESALKPVDSKGAAKEKKVTIPIGSSATGIGEILEKQGIIKDAKVFKYYVKFKNESGFMAGDYKMTTAMSMQEIIESLKTGKVAQEVVFKITIPEGKQLTEIAKIIAEKTDQTHEVVFSQLNSPDFVNLLKEKFPELLTNEILEAKVKYPLEGYLFPATYSFYEENTTVETIVTEMLTKTMTVLDEYSAQMAEQQLSPHKLLTMASLIEEEATAKVDREKIASVFYNRIKAGMPLQTDPTVLYALGEHKSRTLYEDLEYDSPYNTYKYKGTPPGPIANAGTMSIEAALNPDQTDYFYFLATSEGEVIFTKTLNEHNQQKAKHITANK